MSTSERLNSDILCLLLASIREIDPTMQFTQDTIDTSLTLAELGLSSIDRAEIVAMTMELANIGFSVPGLHKGLTISELVTIVSGSGS